MPKHTLRPQGDFPTAGLIRRLAAIFYDFLLCVALVMVGAFFLDVEIVPCPIVRESDGLALSSRNLNLDRCARAKAPLIHELISKTASDLEVSQALSKAGFDVDYVETRYGRRFVAARIGEHPVVRLIDNVPVAM